MGVVPAAPLAFASGTQPIERRCGPKLRGEARRGGIRFAMSWIVYTLQRYPEIGIFLTLAIGFAIGGIKLGKFSFNLLALPRLQKILQSGFVWRRQWQLSLLAQNLCAIDRQHHSFQRSVEDENEGRC